MEVLNIFLQVSPLSAFTSRQLINALGNAGSLTLQWQKVLRALTFSRLVDAGEKSISRAQENFWNLFPNSMLENALLDKINFLFVNLV
ncbi:hypothetical protein AD942_13405 [Gluconobacter japonicus]|nr:hypothetical protein AD942_13405 [Gluconobacter japonicus]